MIGKGRELQRKGPRLVSVHKESPLTDIFRKRAAAATFLISTTPEPETMSDVSYLGSGKKKKNWTVTQRFKSILFI